MTKANFNVPILTASGEPMMKIKLDHTKRKVTEQGNAVSDVMKDADGYVMQEPSLLKDTLSSIVNAVYPGEEKLPYGDRVIRGKLANKIATSSTANYRDSETILIRELMTKSQATPTLIAQVAGLLEGIDDTVDEDTTENEAQKVA